MICLTILPLVSCKTVVKAEEVDREAANKLLLSFISEAPEVPVFPDLDWSYSERLYSLREEDVDRLLVFKVKDLPAFEIEFQAWKESVLAIIKKLAE